MVPDPALVSRLVSRLAGGFSRSKLAAACLASAVALGACSKTDESVRDAAADTKSSSGGADAAKPADAGAGSHDATGAAPDTGGSPAAEAGSAPQSCGGIRTCLYACGNDMNCAKRCVDQAPAAARTLYQKVATCTAKVCSAQEPDPVGCRCMSECLAPGPCTDEVDDCQQGEADPFCEELCH